MSRWTKWIVAPVLLVAAMICVSSSNKAEASPYHYHSYYGPSYGVTVHYGYRPAVYPVYRRAYYPAIYPRVVVPAPVVPYCW